MSTKYYTFYFIYLLINFLTIKNNEIIIPFTSRLSDIPKDLNSPKFIDALINNKLYTNVEIGTPPQKMEFLVDFNFYDSLVIHKNKFDNYSSLTFNQINRQNTYYSSDYKLSYLASDIVSLEKNISNFSLTFLYVIGPKNEPFINAPGIIGFGISQLRNVKFKYSLLDQLKKVRKIKTYQYTLIFNDDNFNGIIILNKDLYENYPDDILVFDYSIFSSEFSYIYNWGWDYMFSYYNSELLPIKNIYLKPELGLIIASDKVKNILREKFFETKIKQNKCYESYYENYYYFHCEKDVNINEFGKIEIIMKLKSMNISLVSEDLFYEYNNYFYFLMIFKNDIDIKDIILGHPFFKKYNTLFNPEEKIVGFYNIKINYNLNDEKNDITLDNKNQKDNNKKESNKINKNGKNEGRKKENNLVLKIIFIIALIIGIFIILFISFYLYRGIKRKRKGKLFEELNP